MKLSRFVVIHGYASSFKTLSVIKIIQQMPNSSKITSFYYIIFSLVNVKIILTNYTLIGMVYVQFKTQHEEAKAHAQFMEHN